MSLLGNLRNKAVEAFVKNHELVKRFGDVQSVSIDSDNGTADVSVLLHGEIFPIKFRGYYYFDDTDTGTDRVNIIIITFYNNFCSKTGIPLDSFNFNNIIA